MNHHRDVVEIIPWRLSDMKILQLSDPAYHMVAVDTCPAVSMSSPGPPGNILGDKVLSYSQSGVFMNWDTLKSFAMLLHKILNVPNRNFWRSSFKENSYEVHVKINDRPPKLRKITLFLL